MNPEDASDHAQSLASAGHPLTLLGAFATPKWRLAGGACGAAWVGHAGGAMRGIEWLHPFASREQAHGDNGIIKIRSGREIGLDRLDNHYPHWQHESR